MFTRGPKTGIIGRCWRFYWVLFRCPWQQVWHGFVLQVFSEEWGSTTDQIGSDPTVVEFCVAHVASDDEWVITHSRLGGIPTTVL